MKLGFIGLGKMGSRMAGKLVSENHELVVWNRSPGPVEELLAEAKKLGEQAFSRVVAAKTVSNLVSNLQAPRVVWMMLPAGGPTESILETISDILSPDDILIDGGNSYYKDTEKHFSRLKERKLRFLGIGVSGGIIAETQGYPLMAGGDKSAYEYIKPALDSLARPGGGHEFFGPGGAGHFVKMVHNGIEYGIMQSLGEGFAVLQKAPYEFDLLKIARLYQQGTLVSGFMLDRAVEVFARDPDLANIEGVIAESGEARWTVEQAGEEGVDIEIIKRSLEYRKRSQTDKRIQNSFAARLIAALRNAFGGHAVQTK